MQMQLDNDVLPLLFHIFLMGGVLLINVLESPVGQQMFVVAFVLQGQNFFLIIYINRS